jgi:hypothetical protein
MNQMDQVTQQQRRDGGRDHRGQSHALAQEATRLAQRMGELRISEERPAGGLAPITYHRSPRRGFQAALQSPDLPPVFSRSRTASMTMPFSAALSMS